MVYTGSATRGGQPTLSPPSVLEALTQLDHMLSKVEHTVLDTIKDVEKKRKVWKIWYIIEWFTWNSLKGHSL